MWTPETRSQHDRKGLRYTHDLTDQEWARVGPLIPPAKRGGNKRTVDVREILNGLMYILAQVASGAISQRISRRAARSMIISTAGATMERCSASITPSTPNAGNWPDAKPVRRLW